MASLEEAFNLIQKVNYLKNTKSKFDILSIIKCYKCNNFEDITSNDVRRTQLCSKCKILLMTDGIINK